MNAQMVAEQTMAVVPGLGGSPEPLFSSRSREQERKALDPATVKANARRSWTGWSGTLPVRRSRAWLPSLG